MRCCCQCWPICSCCGCTGASWSRSKGPRSTHGSNALARRSCTSSWSERSANGGGNSSRRGRQPSRNTATCHFSVISTAQIPAQSPAFYLIDAQPLPVCHPLRHGRVRLLREDGAYWGKTSKGWFFGFKLHVLCHID